MNETEFLYDVVQYFKHNNNFSYQYPMNLTASSPPKLESVHNLISLFIDGLFYDTTKMTTHISPDKINKVIPPH